MEKDDTKYFVVENVAISEEEVVEYVHYYGTKCPDHHEFISVDNEKECVATCGANYEDTNEDGAKICSTGCRSGAFEDVSESVVISHVCVASCEDKFVKISESLKQCVDSCPADHKYLNDTECKAECDSSFYKQDGDDKVCVKQCEDDQFANNLVEGETAYECVDSCTTKAYTQFIISDLRVCISKEDEELCPYYVNQQIESVEETYAHCYQLACPAETYLKAAAERECVSSCDKKPYKQIGLNKVCVDTCTENGAGYRDGDECKDTCASGFYKNEDGNYICVDVCDKDTVETQFAEIAQNGLSQCVDDCEQRFFEDAETKDGKQYRQCVEGEQIKPLSASANGETDAKYFVRETFTTGKGESVEYIHYHDSANCPEDHPYIKSGDSKECIAECGQYFYVEEEHQYCIDSCTEDYKYLQESGQCTSYEQCAGSARFIYDEEEQLLCIDAKTCHEKNGYAYAGIMRCDMTEPEENGHFYEELVEEHIYWCEDDDYSILDTVSEKWKCVSQLQCLTDLHGIFYEAVGGDVCIDRDFWLSTSPMAFVNIDFFAAMYSGEEFPTDPAEVCKDDGVTVPGAVFVAERTCGCPSEGDTKYLGVYGENDELMCSTPAKFDRDHLELTVAYKAGEKDITAYLVLDSDDCTDGMRMFVSPDNTTCIAACPELSPAYDPEQRHCTVCYFLEEEEEPKNLYWDSVNLKCVSECAEGQKLSISKTQCVAECQEPNQMASEGKCVCTANAALAPLGDQCLIPSEDNQECRRRAETDGVLTCISQNCNDYYEFLRLDNDETGYTCVSKCSSGKYEEHDSELRCVEDCAHWWYKTDDDGLCKEEAWRKNTAIAVPIVVIVVIVVVIVIVFVVVKKGCKSKKEESKNGQALRD